MPTKRRPTDVPPDPQLPLGPRSTRRTFLGRSLAAAGGLAFPQIIPSSALGRDGAVAPSDRIVLAGIGLGPRGT